jgi:hypothetical protein
MTAKVIIYVLCYDDNSEKYAKEKYEKEEWAKICRIDTTKYFENIMYYKVLNERINEWEDADYVGTISYKADKKIKVPDFTKVGTYYKGLNKKVDMISFFHFMEERSMIHRTMMYHPLFLNIWKPLLEQLGFTNKQIYDEKIPHIYGNYWMTTPSLMKEYIKFFINAKEIMDNYAPIQQYLNSGAKYYYPSNPIPLSRIIQIFGIPDYSYHPFVSERLPAFFFYTNNKSIEYFNGFN